MIIISEQSLNGWNQNPVKFSNVKYFNIAKFNRTFNLHSLFTYLAISGKQISVSGGNALFF
jgi:hypothetical protein